jgi:hypothetical protein
MIRVLAVIASIFSTSTLACPFHGDMGEEVPYQFRRGAAQHIQTSGSDVTLGIKLINRLKSTTLDFVLEEDSIELPLTAGFQCVISGGKANPSAGRMYMMKCSKPNAHESVTHTCINAQTSPTTWNGVNADGMNTVSIVLSCQDVF